MHIQRNPGQYERSFIEKVYNMADKLKYFDPVLERNLDNFHDEDGTLQSSGQLQWQQDLFNLLGQVSYFLLSHFIVSIQFFTFPQTKFVLLLPFEISCIASRQI